jgi:hypothetical protein
VSAIDELAACLDHAGRDRRFTQRPHPPANSIPRLEHMDGRSSPGELSSCDEPG